MATVVVYKWVSRRSSRRRGGMIISRPREERETQRVILAPPPSWYIFGEREEERRRVPSYLQEVLRNVRTATRNFRARLVDPRDEVATSVCAAQLVIQRVQIPGEGSLAGMAQQRCLMCESMVASRRMPRSRIPDRVSMERFDISIGDFWTLHEIFIYPSWRQDVDSPSRLCAWHASEFSWALDAVLTGVIVPPGRSTLERRRSI